MLKYVKDGLHMLSIYVLVTQKCRMSSRCTLNIKISLISRSFFVWEQDYIKICLWSLLTFATTAYRLCHTLASCPGGRKRWRRNLPALSPWPPESMIPKARAEGRNHLEKFSTPVCMYPTITCTYQSYIILCRDKNISTCKLTISRRLSLLSLRQ